MNFSDKYCMPNQAEWLLARVLQRERERERERERLAHMADFGCGIVIHNSTAFCVGINQCIFFCN